MKTKIIVASGIGLLWIAGMILWATTFASTTGANRAEGFWSWTRMMGNRGGMMQQFANTGDAAAFRTTVEQAISDKDFAAFKAVHTKYNITMNITQDQFTTMIAQRATQEKSLAALKSGDYATWKTINKDMPLLSKIDTEAKFKKLQELETYREKMDTIRTELGLEWPQWEGMWMGGNMKWMMGKWNGKHTWKGMGMGQWLRNASWTSQ